MWLHAVLAPARCSRLIILFSVVLMAVVVLTDVLAATCFFRYFRRLAFVFFIVFSIVHVVEELSLL